MRCFYPLVLIAGLLLPVGRPEAASAADPAPNRPSASRLPGLSREVLDLDGVWDFATDPERAGESNRWFRSEQELPRQVHPGDAPAIPGKIRVPGIWDNQGYGAETDKVRHNFVGLGWYQRRLSVPAGWAGKRIFLWVGGVHRSARTWVNGQFLGEHIGYLSDFEYELTALVKPGAEVTVTLQVDSRQRWAVDPLFGASDLADYMDVAWGGIWGHVRLEARSAAWLSDLFLQPNVGQSSCLASAQVNGEIPSADELRLEVFDVQERRVAQATKLLSSGDGPVVQLSALIPDPQLWSPDSPTLYHARLSLRNRGQILDAVEARFGMREIRLDGSHILLNGRRLFLRGYGDDHIYPERMAMPVDKDLHLSRLRLIKQYGFNHVRHHSTIMPPEYYDACDEVGIMPTAEFPIVYDSFLPGGATWKLHVPEGTDTAPGFDTYRREWAAAIKRHRNHPCIFAWVMGNELWNGIPLRHDFQRIARELDPARLFADTDGVTEMWQHILDPKNDRTTLNLYFLMFDVSRNPLDLPGKYELPRPNKPVVSHESGNYVTFTPPSRLEAFRDNVKPFWMTGGRDKLDRLGLLPEAELWAQKSERLYLTLHKTDLEALRLNADISGYHWWLFQDYWTTANGLVDHYFHPKAIAPDEVRCFNNDVVLLEQGLDLTYRGEQRMRVGLRVSNFSPDRLTNALLNWELWAEERLVAQEQKKVVAVDQGMLAEIAQIDRLLPRVERPVGLRLRARLSEGQDGWHNEWTTWLYPALIVPPKLSVPAYAAASRLRRYPGLGLSPMPTNGPLASQAVYVAAALNQRLVAAVEQGAGLVLLDAGGKFKSRPLTYRSSWWKAGDDLNANLCGTLVYDHPATRAIAPDGWCDPGWFQLLEGGRKFTLEGFPVRPQVIIRALSSLRAVEDSAVLFEVTIGKGLLVVSGLNHQKATGRPENDWLLARLLEHAAQPERPGAHWPTTALPIPEPLPVAGALSGFRRLLRNEGEEGAWYSYREDNIRMPICRQTQPGHAIEWETAAAPADAGAEQVSFVFAGGLGWRSEPKTDGFEFLVNGEKKLVFDLVEEHGKWTSADGKVTLQFVLKRTLPEDRLGWFYVTLARGEFKPGEPCRFTVRSLGRGSHRWFALHPYDDLTEEE